MSNEDLIFVEWEMPTVRGILKSVGKVSSGNMYYVIQVGSQDRKFITLQSGIPYEIEPHHLIGKKCEINKGLFRSARFIKGSLEEL